jgi:hypothetical protein
MINLRNYVHHQSRMMRALRRKNVRPGERWLSLLAGAGLAVLALRRWRSQGAALAASSILLRRALTGDCPVYRRMRWSST